MPEKLSRRERQRIQHREDILNAAEFCFAEKGFHATTVEDIAQRAEFAVGTLYKFFSSKDEIYEALIRQRVTYLVETGIEALAGITNVHEFIHAFIQTKVQLCCAKPEFLRMYTRERMSDRFAKTALWTDFSCPQLGRLFARMKQAFDLGIQSGDLRSDIASDDMIVALDNLTDGFLFNALDIDDINKYTTKVQTMMNIFLNGVKDNHADKD